VLLEELSGQTYAQDLKARGVPAWKALLRTLGWAFAAPVRPRSFLARVHRWFWFSRPRRVAIALVQVEEAAWTGMVGGRQWKMVLSRP
jgi:hypothetical protein